MVDEAANNRILLKILIYNKTQQKLILRGHDFDVTQSGIGSFGSNIFFTYFKSIIIKSFPITKIV